MKKFFLFCSTIIIVTNLISLQSFCQPKYLINLAENLTNKGQINLSTIAESIEYIPLETYPDCILDQDYTIKLTDEYIFVDDFKNIYRFTRNGKFLNKIGKQGKGPGEYVRLVGFEIDDSKKEVFLLDLIEHKVLVYNYDGAYLRKLKFQFSGLFMSSINGKYLIHNNMFYNHFTENKPTYDLEVVDFDGKKIHQFESTLDRSKKYGLTLIFPHFYNFNKQTYLKFPLNDTLFCFPIPWEKNAYAVLNSVKYKRDEKHADFRDGEFLEDNSSIVVTAVEESEHYMFISYTKKDVYRLVFDKNSKKSLNVFTGLSNLIETKKEANYTKGLVNDIDGGFPFWPQKIQDSIMIDFRYAYEFKYLNDNWFRKSNISDREQMKKLKEIAGTIN